MLRERFQAPGAREPWSDLVRAVTGKPLGAADFIGGLVGDGRNEVPAVSIDP
jgi:hypothetical protein